MFLYNIITILWRLHISWKIWLTMISNLNVNYLGADLEIYLDKIKVQSFHLNKAPRYIYLYYTLMRITVCFIVLVYYYTGVNWNTAPSIQGLIFNGFLKRPIKQSYSDLFSGKSRLRISKFTLTIICYIIGNAVQFFNRSRKYKMILINKLSSVKNLYQSTRATL